MGKQSLTGIVKHAKIAMQKHSPEILTGIGIVGMITTTVLAVRATPKALILLKEAQDEAEHEILPISVVIKETWKCYIPSVVIGGVSMFCLIGASSANLRRNAALATAYTLSESALKEYREKVIEAIGEKKEQIIRDAVAKDKIDRDPVINREVLITEKGSTLCYDAISGRYFKSDIDKLKKAANNLSREMLNVMYISLNDFYYEIGLSNTKLGDDLGWCIEDGLIDLNFSSQLADDGTPCLVLDYLVTPRYGYCR